MSASTKKNKQILLASRPENVPGPKNFSVVETDILAPTKPNQVVVKVLYLSLDPAMRGWMRDVKSYIPPVALNSVMRANAIGRVVASTAAKFPVKSLVQGMLGWQEYYVGDAQGLSLLPKVPPSIPLTAFLGVLGGTGLTAYFGLLEVGKPQAGETVLVSGAAGAVGSVVGQIAKLKGCRVVGIAGSQEKCDWLVKDLGFDAAINYKTTGKKLTAEIRKACPKGIDVFFDNVGGEILDIALSQLRFRARVVICGAISQYNENRVLGPVNYLSLLVNNASMTGFVVFHYKDKYREATMDLLKWVMEGKLKYKEDVVEGLLTAPTALLKLFDGSNSGKLLVKVAPDADGPAAKL